MDRKEVLADVAKLISDVDRWNCHLLTARSKFDEDEVRNAHWTMEGLLVGVYQELKFLKEYIGTLCDEKELEQAYKYSDEVQYKNGYDKGYAKCKDDILKELKGLRSQNTPKGMDSALSSYIKDKELL